MVEQLMNTIKSKPKKNGDTKEKVIVRVREGESRRQRKSGKKYYKYASYKKVYRVLCFVIVVFLCFFF